MELNEHKQASTPMQLLEIAMSQNADLDKLTKLMELNDRWQANQARMAFVQAMAKFKENPPKIIKDKQVSFSTTKYKHADLNQVTSVIGQALSQVGISHRWVIHQAENAFVEVTCLLTHVEGHSEATTLRAPVDSSGGKNAIQGVGSAVSYLQRYTLLAATGMATGEEDTDAIDLSKNPALAAIWACKTELELKTVYEREFKTASDARNMNLQKAIIDAKNQKKRELSK